MYLDESIYPKERIELRKDIYEGHPPWERVKKSGLYGRGERRMFSLGCARVLCDCLAALTFSSQADIYTEDEKTRRFILGVLDENSFWENMPAFLSRTYALGSGAVRVYMNEGRVCLDFASAEGFVPLGTHRGRVSDGLFRGIIRRGGKRYTLLEHHRFEKGRVCIERRLTDRETGEDTDIRAIGLSEREYTECSVPLFACFRPKMPDPSKPSLCGESAFEGCIDTIHALDTVFDSLVREFVLGRKRIIVPSSCIRTVVDPDTGKISRYFDADDEVYQALCCDDEKDLKIVDNTAVLRVEEHTDAINALLDILCFQTGLSAGTLSFSAGGVKTAAEVRSMQLRTESSMQQYRALCAEFLEDLVQSILACGEMSGEPVRADAHIRISFPDTQTTDIAEMIDRNIRLVDAGLRSKAGAVMNINDCTEDEAEKELERAEKERRRENG